MSEIQKRIIATEAAPAAIGPYSQAIAAGSLVFTSGQIPIDPATGVFPEGILPEDILGVEVGGSVAVVNLSGSFYSRCQLMNASAERRLIYAMVNALTELIDVGAVRFIVEGSIIDTMVQSIYLRTPLLPDPGIVHDGDSN